MRQRRKIRPPVCPVPKELRGLLAQIDLADANRTRKRRVTSARPFFNELLAILAANCRKCEQAGVQSPNGGAGMGLGLGWGSSTMEYNSAFGSPLVQSPSINSAGMTPITVLIVEDDEVVRALAAELLSDAGFQVLEASNGEEALSLLESESNVRVLFTDIKMPGPLDGIALASVAAVQWPHLAIIIGSGDALPLSAGLPRGIKFIRKPCNPESLVRLILEGTTTRA